MSNKNRLNRLALVWFVIGLVFLLPCEDNSSAAIETGATKGTFNVDSFGAAKYTIPIEVPPGTNGMQPDLSLVYDNHSGNGMLGVGWALKGLSKIRRCGQSYASDGFNGRINFDDDDRFCIEGDKYNDGRLIAIKGIYGADKSEYRTEIETWTKFVANKGDSGLCNTGYRLGKKTTGPCSFDVWLKDGTHLEYGNTKDSKINAVGHDFSPVSDTAAIRVWALNKITDTNGNSIDIAYSFRSSSPLVNPNMSYTHGQYYPIRIDYTSNGTSKPQRSVQFIYETRKDSYKNYATSSLVDTKVQLSKINTCVSNGDDISNSLCTDGSSILPVKQYELTYNATTTSPTARSTLQSIQECGFDPDNLTTTTCLPPTIFRWQNIAAEGGGTNFGQAVTSKSIAIGPNDEYLWADFNGDGLTDLILRTNFGTSIDVYKSTKETLVPINETGPTLKTKLPSACDQVSASKKNDHYGIWTDFNGDGKMDFVCNDYIEGTTQVLLSDGTDFQAATTLSEKIKCTSTQDSWLIWADFDGDSKIDFVCNDYRLSVTNLWTSHDSYQLHPVDTNLSSTGPFACGDTNDVLTWADYNGDHMADFICSNSDSGTTRVLLSTATGFQSMIPSDSTGVVSALLQCSSSEKVWSDYNGDGLIDFICHDNSDSTGTVFLSMGDGQVGFTKLPITLNNATQCPNANSGEWEDFNGDGKIDYVCTNTLFKSSVNFFIMISNGTSKLVSPNGDISGKLKRDVNCAHHINQFIFKNDWADVNGDGLPDFICTQQGQSLSVIFNNPGSPDLLLSINDGMGAITEISYTPLTDPSIYATGSDVSGELETTQEGIGLLNTKLQTSQNPIRTSGPNLSPSYPGFNFQSFLNVVTGYTVTNNPAQNNSNFGLSHSCTGNVAYCYSYLHSYTGGRVDLSRKSWMGFEEIQKIDNQLIARTINSYQPSFPFSSLLSGISKYDKGILLHSRVYNYECFDSQSNNSDCTAKTTVYKPLLQKLTTADKQYGYTISKTFQYDMYGNVIQLTDQGVDSQKKPNTINTCMKYAVNKTKWQLDYKSTTLKTTRTACPTNWQQFRYDSTKDYSQAQYLYDTTGSSPSRNLLIQGNWDDTHKRWLGNIYTYDPFGNQITVSDFSNKAFNPTVSTLLNTTYTTVYDSTYNTFPTSRTTPIPNSNNKIPAMIKYFSYEPRFGKQTALADVNGNVTTNCLDGFGRALAKQGPAPTRANVVNSEPCPTGSASNTTLASNKSKKRNNDTSPFAKPVVTLSTHEWKTDTKGETKIYREDNKRHTWGNTTTPAEWAMTKIYYDSLSRVYRHESPADESANGSIIVDSTYLNETLVSKQSLPYFSTVGNPSWIATTYFPSGRIANYTLPYQNSDGSISELGTRTSWNYSAPNKITASIENNLTGNSTYTKEAQFAIYNSKQKITSLVISSDTQCPKTQYAYDSIGRLISVENFNTTPPGQSPCSTNEYELVTSTNISSDSLNRKTKLSNTNTGSHTYIYNKINKTLSTITDSIGQIISYKYDNFKRITSKTITSAKGPTDYQKTLRFTYDLPMIKSVQNIKGRLSSLSTYLEEKKQGHVEFVSNYNYSPYGQMTRKLGNFPQDAISYDTKKEFDPQNRITKLLNNNGAQSQSNTYTPAGQPYTISYSLGNGAAEPFVTYSHYSALHRPEKITYKNGLIENYKYYLQGPVMMHQIESSSGEFSYVDGYNWDQFSNLIDNTDCSAKVNDSTPICLSLGISGTQDSDYSQSFVYKNKQLISANSGSNIYPPMTYSYDQAGNLTHINGDTYTYDGNQVKTGPNGFSAKYDSNGNMTSKMDAKGQNWKMTYDPMDQLTSIKKNQVKVEDSYKYDHMRRRFKKVAYEQDGKTVKATSYYLSPSYETTKFPNGIQSSTFYLLNSGSRVASITLQQSIHLFTPPPGYSTNGTIYYHKDQVGSTKLVTDENGKVVSRVVYQPYGTIESITSDQFRPKYNGKELDEGSQLYYFEPRYYDPSIGQFITADKRLEASNLYVQNVFNSYAYGFSNPVSYLVPNRISASQSVQADTSDAFMKGVTTEVELALGEEERIVGDDATAIEAITQIIEPRPEN